MNLRVALALWAYEVTKFVALEGGRRALFSLFLFWKEEREVGKGKNAGRAGVLTLGLFYKMFNTAKTSGESTLGLVQLLKKKQEKKEREKKN